MKITKRRLQRIIRESQWGGFTGGAAPLDEPPLDSGEMDPEQQQKVFDILVSTGSDPKKLMASGEFPDVVVEMKITKRRLQRIIKEVLLVEQNPLEGHEMYEKDDELRELGEAISQMVVLSRQVEERMNDMGSRYGELTALGTHSSSTKKVIKELEDKFGKSLDNLSKSHERGWYDK